jgi:hypothetical protein
MDIKQYKVKIKHDNGYFKLIVNAMSYKRAVEVACKAENCPESAIISITDISDMFKSKRR